MVLKKKVSFLLFEKKTSGKQIFAKKDPFKFKRKIFRSSTAGAASTGASRKVGIGGKLALPARHFAQKRIQEN